MENIVYYDWLAFFGEISKRINELSKDLDTREKTLSDIARATFKDDHVIFKYNAMDPFSYLYALAQRNTKKQRRHIFTNAKEAFAISIDIPTDVVFPTPGPHTPGLFYLRGAYYNKEGQKIGNGCIWNLFQQIYNGTEISEEDFQSVLSLENGGFTRVSQVMSLINPKKYIPFDTQINNLEDILPRIENDGVKVYLNAIEEVKNSFPGCELYEINLLNVLINSNESDQLIVSDKYYQISSQNDKNNAEPTTPNGTMVNLKRGDIVLQRSGTKNLGGIGVIVDNEKSINIIWLTRENKYVEDDALGQWDGCSPASDKTIGVFKEVYPITFQLLYEIRAKQGVMVNHSQVKHKNLILHGPPGTGKTRLAKQIAEWLVRVGEREMSLIAAIDNNQFNKEPDIESLEQIKLIQFHSSYSYENFVRSIEAVTEHGMTKYVVEKGILVKFAEEAAKPENKNKTYVLIIDEINRANLTAVLGEFIYALEYRGQSVDSMYEYNGDSQISLPHNLYVIGTMNTADRSVTPIDYGIRRRFTFIPVLPTAAAIKNDKAKALYAKVKLIFDTCLSPEFNKDDIQIGHSYFLYGENEIGMQLKYEIKPLLHQYVKDGILLESAIAQINALNVQ